MRGFKDGCLYMETFAGTATRWAQRVVNSVAATEPSFCLFSFDVSKAFAKGMSFEELAELTGQEVRRVEFKLQAVDVPIIRRIPGFETFDPETEVLSMLKSIYGLKDAPRAWRKKLDQVLQSFGMRPSTADAQIYLLHGPGVKANGRRELKLILSTHVDDLKGRFWL